ncbi:hypothetical protein FQZ97_1034170 [compost metagenome]
MRLAILHQRHRLAGQELLRSLGHQRGVDHRVDVDFDAGATGQANVEIGRALAVADAAIGLRFDGDQRFGDNGRFGATAGDIADGRAILRHRHLAAQRAGRGAIDQHQRHQGHAQAFGGPCIEPGQHEFGERHRAAGHPPRPGDGAGQIGGGERASRPVR